MVDERLDVGTIAGLLGLLAHDLRNPLSALHSNVGFLAAGPRMSEDDAREAVADALVSCDGLIHIIDNIELLAHALSDASPRSRSPVALASVVAEVVSTHRALAESHEVTLELAGSAADPAYVVWVQRDMYRRALENLVRNAIQYGVSHPVNVSVRSANGDVELVITDRGPAFDTKLGQGPFTASGQLAAKGAMGGRYGRGLGLFCARFAAESAGATVEAVLPSGGTGNSFVLRARPAK